MTEEEELKKTVLKARLGCCVDGEEAFNIFREAFPDFTVAESLQWLKDEYNAYVAFDADGSWDDVRCVLHAAVMYC